jgi:hypothetical protein
MRWLLGLLLLLPVTLHGTGGTLEGAATKAFQTIQTLPGHDLWEYGGIIVIKNGKYYFSAVPATDKKGDAVLVDVLKLKGDSQLAGVYHTHPCLEDYWTGLYSFSDIIQQMYWKVPSFIYDACTKEIHEFDSSVDRVRDTGRNVQLDSGKVIHLPSGRIVGHL